MVYEIFRCPKDGVTISRHLKEGTFKRIIKEYREECAIDCMKGGRVAYDTYDMLFKAGVLRVFFVCVDGIFQGFFFLVFQDSLHESKLMCQVDAIFVRKKYRSLILTNMILDRIKREARLSKATCVLFHTPVGGRFDKFFELTKNAEKTHSIWCIRV